MLLVEQYVTRALAMADRVVLLNRGSVAYDGQPSELDEQAGLGNLARLKVGPRYEVRAGSSTGSAMGRSGSGSGALKEISRTSSGPSFQFRCGVAGGVT
jgi:ABC-type multidrug transport system ATPase subunit